ncbi:MAG: hypothetical protein AB7K24_32035, partial [Gemmataceae bacterium]
DLRGIALAAPLFVQLLEAQPLQAAVPAGLQAATLQAGMAASLGHAALVPLVSPRTLTLAEGALHTMFLKKIKVALAAVAALVLVAVGIGVNSSFDQAQAVPIDEKVVDAAKPALEVRLIAKDGKFVLDEQLAKRVQAFNNIKVNNNANIRANAIRVGNLPAQPANLVLQLKNNSDQPIRVATWGDVDEMSLKLEMAGPGVEEVKMLDLRKGRFNIQPVNPMALPIKNVPIKVNPAQPVPRQGRALPGAAPVPANAPAILPVAPAQPAPAQAPEAPADNAKDPNQAQPVPAQPARPIRVPVRNALPVPAAAPAVLPAQPNAAPVEPKIVEIPPGKTYELPIEALRFAEGRMVHQLYWTKAGKYEIKATVTLYVNPAPKDAAQAERPFGVPEGFGPVVVTSQPVTVEVTEK